MLIDFEHAHRTYLIPSQNGHGRWVHTPANATSPKTGKHLVHSQVFSNNALLVSVYIYNGLNESGECISAKHCLYLQFTRKVDGNYLLGSDEKRLSFNLDIGQARALYRFAVGIEHVFSMRIVRPNQAPRTIEGNSVSENGILAASLRAGKGGTVVSVELSGADLFTLAAHALAYGRLLYPALSDSAIQQMFMAPMPIFRACAENSPANAVPTPEPSAPETGITEERKAPVSIQREQMNRIIWAIGNQKWPGMELAALKRIQREASDDEARAMIDEGNAGRFELWDHFLGEP